MYFGPTLFLFRVYIPRCSTRHSLSFSQNIMTLAGATLVAIVATGCEFNLHKYLHLWLRASAPDWLTDLIPYLPLGMRTGSKWFSLLIFWLRRKRVRVAFSREWLINAILMRPKVAPGRRLSEWNVDTLGESSKTSTLQTFFSALWHFFVVCLFVGYHASWVSQDMKIKLCAWKFQLGYSNVLKFSPDSRNIFSQIRALC